MSAPAATAATPKPTIARIWRGRATRARADEYAAYLYEHGIKPLEEKALGVLSLREDRETESEFITISYWADIPASPAPTRPRSTTWTVTPSS